MLMQAREIEVKRKNRIREFTYGCGYTLSAAAFFFSTKYNGELAYELLYNREDPMHNSARISFFNAAAHLYFTFYLLSKSYEKFKAAFED